MTHVLITGADSYVGTNVERWLMREPEKYQVDTLNMIDGSWRKKDFSGYDVVFHVAGIAHVNSKKNMEDLYYKVNTDLAIETAQRAKQCNVKQFIFMSSIIVYGESRSFKPVFITKETKPKPNGFYGNSKLQAEIGIKKIADEHFKVVILRPPMIYGKGCNGNFPALEKLALCLPIFPKVVNNRSMLYITNLAEFVRLVIVHVDSGVFFPQNKEYSNTSNLVQTIAELKGKKIRLLGGFTWVIRLLGYFNKSLVKAFGTFVYCQEISEYKQTYQKYSLAESLREMEDLNGKL